MLGQLRVEGISLEKNGVLLIRVLHQLSSVVSLQSVVQEGLDVRLSDSLQFPDKKESVPDVLIGRPEAQVDLCVNYLGDRVDEHQHSLLEDLGAVCEVPDIAESEDCVDDLGLLEGVYLKRVALKGL